jgi:hypothetical protein
MQRHFGGDLRQRLAQEVRCPHAGFYGAEGMLDRLSPAAHRFRIAIEPLLHGFQHVLVLPSRDAPLRSCRAFRLERALGTRRRPVAAHQLAVFLARHAVLQPLLCEPSLRMN